MANGVVAPAAGYARLVALSDVRRHRHLEQPPDRPGGRYGVDPSRHRTAPARLQRLDWPDRRRRLSGVGRDDLVGRNGAGGIFQTSNSILFGWPGRPCSIWWLACGSRCDVELPERFSRYTLRGLSALALVPRSYNVCHRAVLARGNANALTTMTTTMTQTANRTPWRGS